MRSLWKTIAVRRLRGEGSPALVGDTPLHDLLSPEDQTVRPEFLVRRSTDASYCTIMTQPGERVCEGAAADGRGEPGQDRR